MELILVVGIFAASFFLLSIGVLFAKKEIRAGSCGSKVIIEHGMDIVELEQGKVKRNEVYFNLANLLTALNAQ